MLKKIALLLGLLGMTAVYANGYSQSSHYQKNGYQIRYSHCQTCQLSDEDQKIAMQSDRDTLLLEHEKAYGDAATGDEPDAAFIEATAYKITRHRSIQEPLTFAMLIKRNGLNYAVIQSFSGQGQRTLICIPPKADNSEDIRKMLLSTGCQGAIERFNMPLSIDDIQSLVSAKGSLN